MSTQYASFGSHIYATCALRCCDGMNKMVRGVKTSDPGRTPVPEVPSVGRVKQ